MKSTRHILIVLLGTSFAAGASDCRAQSSTPVDARITGLACEAEFRKDASAPIVRLRGAQNVGRGLLAGNQIRCAGSGSVEILVPEGTQKITFPQPWFTVKPVSAAPYAYIADDLRNIGIPGATRGGGISSRINWPSENSVILPEHFAIRWTPVAQKVLLSIMSEAKDVTLWGPVEIDGGTGVLKSDAVSSILAGYSAKSDHPALILILSLANGNDWEETHFSLLSGQRAHELDVQLDFWDKHTDGLALRLGRGYSFARFKLFAEAADEYDSALESAPDSRYLLEKAIQANRLAGRTDRGKDLQKRLASQPEQ